MITFKKYSSIKCIVEKSEQYYIITILYIDLQRKRPDDVTEAGKYMTVYHQTKL